MQAEAQHPSPRASYHRPATITTTLYDLMEAVQEEVSPEEEGLLVEVVADLLDSGRVRFTGNPEGLDVDMV